MPAIEKILALMAAACLFTMAPAACAPAPEGEAEREVVVVPNPVDGLDEREALDKLLIVGIDERRRMIFAVYPPDIVERLSFWNTIEENAAFIAGYAEFARRFRAGWAGDWSLSIFDDERYVGRRSDPAIRALGADWFGHYLVHYSTDINRLILNPLLPEKRFVARCG